MDTVITVQISEDNKEVLIKCEKMIYDYENLFSKTIETSDIYCFNEHGSGIEVSPFTIELVEKALGFANATGGLFNPVLQPIIEQWSHGVVPDLIIKNIDFNEVNINGNSILKSDPSIQFDLGGIAKGYVCEKLVEQLKSDGIKYGIISLGGNIGVFGYKPNGEKWNIAIRDPFETEKTVGTVSIDEGYISVSGDYQRYFEVDGKRYHHIIDPRTFYPAESGVSSVAVWAKDGTLADALSTALFVMGVEEGMKFHASGVYDFEVMFITKEKITMSKNFEENFKYD